MNISNHPKCVELASLCDFLLTIDTFYENRNPVVVSENYGEVPISHIPATGWRIFMA